VTLHSLHAPLCNVLSMPGNYSFNVAISHGQLHVVHSIFEAILQTY
jgi:hypothetical protein